MLASLIPGPGRGYRSRLANTLAVGWAGVMLATIWWPRAQPSLRGPWRGGHIALVAAILTLALAAIWTFAARGQSRAQRGTLLCCSSAAGFLATLAMYSTDALPARIAGSWEAVILLMVTAPLCSYMPASMEPIESWRRIAIAAILATGVWLTVATISQPKLFAVAATAFVAAVWVGFTPRAHVGYGASAMTYASAILASVQQGTLTISALDHEGGISRVASITEGLSASRQVVLTYLPAIAVVQSAAVLLFFLERRSGAFPKALLIAHILLACGLGAFYAAVSARP